MALNPKLAAARRTAALDTLFDVLTSGKMIYADGTQPADADTAVAAQVDLADLAFGSPAFAAAASASKAANAITQDSAANANGTCTWVTLIVAANSFSQARVMDMSASTSGANINMNSNVIAINAAVSCSGLTLTMAA